MKQLHLIVLTPSGAADPSLAIAAARAGAFGVLNLDFTTAERAEQALARLARFTARPCGIRCEAADADLLARLLPRLPANITTVVLTAPAEPTHIAHLQAARLQVWLEITDLDQALAAQAAGADAVIAKGHEAGGLTGEETTLILLQRLAPALTIPVFAQGGIGLHTAAAACVAGASGVVLDAQLALLRESRLPDAAKQLIARLDGSETVQLGAHLGAGYRVLARPAAPVIAELTQLALALTPDRRDEWRRAVAARVGWGAPEQTLWLLGQDAAFAADWAARFRTVGGVVRALQAAVAEHLDAARRQRPLAADSPLARSHGTRYPIVQGPMTRVSDTAAFAQAVADAGALPFLALALMRAPEVEALLAATAERLPDRPWGVGVLGFVPPELRIEQLDVVRRFRPPFAIIAGGRPDQARALEADGIAAYLHVPSPGLLKLFLRDGARRFIFEGKECGGHIGPRSSFVLWETMVETLLAHLPADPSQLHVLFAGGIHDARSAAMVAALAAPLAERGVRLGVLCGTAYLFTREAVETGAILPTFQEAAVAADRTVTVESGPGHAIRCIANPFTQEFEETKRRLLATGLTADKVREDLDGLNIGRLRIAAKGVTRHPRYRRDPAAPKFLTLSPAEQLQQGMYMIGQVAALRDRPTTMADLHRAIAEGSALLNQLGPTAQVEPAPRPQPANIAIIGMSCLLPGAADLTTYWENILDGVYAIGEVPPERWDADLYFDPDPKARDQIYSRWGGFVGETPFDPLQYGMPPNSLPSIEPMQLLALQAAHNALRDAGYGDGTDLRNTGVILGASGGLGDLGSAYLLRSYLPLLLGRDAAAEVIAAAGDRLPAWTEDSFAGILLNVIAGRIANRLDCGGVNYVVDAACGSSLAAVHLAVKELTSGSCDMVITGGVDTVQSPFGYLCFSKTRALSPTGTPRTFDEQSDGIAISEGVVMLVLKRLADAERDGDRIYAVIQGAGGSSDGRALGMTAPRPEGQRLALERVYAQAGIDPRTVALFEAHGTGTAVGDRTEALALGQFLADHGAAPNSVAVGSVKSMIGHTKASAGAAGLVKAALALYHKALPPTLHVQRPNPRANFGRGPLYVNSAARPWIHAADHPRRAGVSAFGFGGTNFHVALEEYTGNFVGDEPAPRQHRPNELLLWSADDPAELAERLRALRDALRAGARPALADLAYTLWQAAQPARPLRLAVICADVAQLPAQLDTALARLADGPFQTPDGVIYRTAPLDGRVALLFPGQGSQYPNMLRDLALEFDEVRAAFETADRCLPAVDGRPLSRLIFPPPAFDREMEQAQQAALTQTAVAQPALGAASLGLLALLQALGVEGTCALGHSYGEYPALYAAGAYDAETLLTLSAARGRCLAEAAAAGAGAEPSGMAAVSADAATVARLLAGLPDVWPANFNAPQQTIIAGRTAGLEQAAARCREAGVRYRPLEVAAAFHSPLVATAQQTFAAQLEQAAVGAPRIPVYANTTGRPHGPTAAELRAELARGLAQPVQFAAAVEALYADGARIFVEVGPRNVLTGLIGQILGDRPHLAVACDRPGRRGVAQLHHALAELWTAGVPLSCERLFAGRRVRALPLRRLVEDGRPAPLSPTTWMVSGGRARPLQAPPGPQLRPLDRPWRAPQQPPNAPTAPQTGAPNPAADYAAAVEQYRQIMSTFLATQRDLLATVLTQPTPPTPAPLSALPPVPAPVERVLVKTAAAVTAPAPAPVVVQPTAAVAAVAVTRGAPNGRAVPAEQPRSSPPPAPRPKPQPEPQPTSLPRLLVEMVAAPLPPAAPLPTAGPSPLLVAAVYVITADGGALTAALAERIAAAGARAHVVQADQIADPAAAAAAVAAARAHGRVAGLFHLAGWQRGPAFAQFGPHDWETAVQRDVVSAFLLLQQLDRELTAEGALALALTHGAAQPHQAALDGLLRTVQHEYPAAHTRLIAVEEPPDDAATADLLWRELHDPAREPLVLWRGERRFVRRIREASAALPLPTAVTRTVNGAAPTAVAAERAPEIRSDDVVLVTGGARGITAHVALALARTVRPTLILLGRSPFPGDPELPNTHGVAEPAALKRLIFEHMRRQSLTPTAVEVEQRYRRLCAEREMRANIAALAETGADIHYFIADMRDGDKLRAVVEQVTERFGAITGVIHGAGLVEDRRIVDKSADSFRRVFGAKADGLWHLTRLLDPQRLRWMALFSSVAGVYGNRGQVDYAAANALLNGLAAYLDTRWPARVTATCWGPWQGAGMVSAELEQQFRAAGVGLIPVEAGCRALMDELRFGRKGQHTVVYAAPAVQAAAAVKPAAQEVGR